MKMTTDVATPRPWTCFVGNSNGRGLIRIESSGDATIPGEHVASLTRDKEANAELIVRAVNSYEAMRIALRRIREKAGHSLESGKFELQTLDSIDEMAEAALKLTEKGVA